MINTNYSSLSRANKQLQLTLPGIESAAELASSLILGLQG